MSDPERILAGSFEGEDAELEYRLFASLRDVSPPPGAESAAWDGIARHIGAAGIGIAAGAAAGHAATQTALSQAPATAPLLTTGATTAKTLAVGVLNTLAGKVAIGVATVATLAAIGNKALNEPVSAVPSKAVAVNAPAPRVEPIPEPPVVVSPSPPSEATEVGAAAPEASGGSREIQRVRQDERLRQESALLTEARARLRNGNPRGSLATLQTLNQRYPNGMLGQEREVLAIQALAALGEAGAAQRRARAFVKAHPASPHAPLLRTFTGSP